jgi:hypothetical protein
VLSAKQMNSIPIYITSRILFFSQKVVSITNPKIVLIYFLFLEYKSYLVIKSLKNSNKKYAMRIRIISSSGVVDVDF